MRGKEEAGKHKLVRMRPFLTPDEGRILLYCKDISQFPKRKKEGKGKGVDQLRTRGTNRALRIEARWYSLLQIDTRVAEMGRGSKTRGSERRNPISSPASKFTSFRLGGGRKEKKR